MKESSDNVDLGADASNKAAFDDVQKQSKYTHLREKYIRLKRRRNIARNIKNSIHVLLMLVVLCVIIVLRIIAQGIPRYWIDKIEDEFSTDIFAVEMEGVSFTLTSGLRVERLSVYPRGIIHKPLFEMRKVGIMYRVKSFENLLDNVKEVKIDSLVLSRIDKDAYKKTAKEGLEEKSDLTIIKDMNQIKIFCRKARVFDVDFRNFSAKVASRDNVLLCDEFKLHCESREKSLDGVLRYDLTEAYLDINAEGYLKPTSMIPLLKCFEMDTLVREIGKAELREIPYVEMRVKYSPTANLRNLSISLDADNMLYNGVETDTVKLTVSAGGDKGWTQIDFPFISIKRPEGVASGNMRIDREKMELDFSVVVGILPSKFLQAIGVLRDESQFPFDVTTPFKSTMSGVLGLADENEDLFKISGTVEASQLSYMGIPINDVHGWVDMRGGDWRISNVVGELFGGALSADINFAPQLERGVLNGFDQVNYSGTLKANNMKASKLQNHFRSIDSSVKDKASGTVDLNASLQGEITGDAYNDLKSMNGEGDVVVKNALLFRFPLFAGLTDFLATTIPGVDFLVAQENLDAKFDISNYGIHVKKMNIDGTLFSISGYGDLWFTKHLDLIVKVHLLNNETWVGKGVRYILFPISKIFELQAFGPVTSPEWKTSTLSFGREKTTPEQRGEVKPKE